MQRHSARGQPVAFLFVGPYLLCFLGFFFIPAIASLAISFTRWDISGSPRYTGVSNYARLVADPLAWKALGNTAYYTLAIVPIMTVVGLGLALLVNMPLRGRIAVRTTVFACYVVMVSVVGILWRWILEPRYGILNFYLTRLGLSPVNWLTDPRTAMLSIVLTTVWWTAGYNMVLYLAGLQEIPQELYEAAKVDGASSWRTFWHVTLPNLRHVTFFVIVMSLARSFQMFGQVFVMTQGGPSNSTLTLVQYIYNVAFRWYELGYAAALSYVLFAILLVITWLQFALQPSEEW